jgi:DNA-binding IclR family transcriptional regulator
VAGAADEAEGRTLQPAAERKAGVSSTDGLQTLHRALAILDLFTPTREEWTASEVAEEAGLSLATASRFMRGLEAHGLLARPNGRSYRLGAGAIDLGQRALQAVDFRTPLRPIAVALARDSDETCLVLALTELQDGVKVIDRAEVRQGARISVTIGHVLTGDAGLAKVLVAYLAPDEQEAVLGHKPSRVLAKEYELIVEQGFVVSFEGVDKGTWGVAAPVLGRSGHPMAAIGLVAPTSRHSATAEKRLTTMVRSAAAQAAARLNLPQDLRATPRTQRGGR